MRIMHMYEKSPVFPYNFENFENLIHFMNYKNYFLKNKKGSYASLLVYSIASKYL